jgi:hypothetical protein
LATVVYFPRALEHLERSFLFLAQNDVDVALKAAAAADTARKRPCESPGVD